MTDGLHGWPQSRSDSYEITYSEVGGTRRRIRLEPGETHRWALCESRWDPIDGRWVPVGTEPVEDVFIDDGREVRR